MRSEILSTTCEWCPDGEVVCGSPITHTSTEQLAGVCDSCFTLRAAHNAQEELSRSASEILAYAEEQPRPAMSERRAHVVPAPYKNGDHCVWCCYICQRPWLAPKDALNWEHEAYFRDLRITAPATNPTKRETDRAFAKSLPRISVKALPFYCAEVGTAAQGVDDWLREKWAEHDGAEKHAPATGKENYQYGACCIWSRGVLSHKPKTLVVPHTVHSALAWKPAAFTHTEPHAVRYSWAEMQEAKSLAWIERGHVEEHNTSVQEKPLPEDLLPLRVPVLTKIVGNELLFEERYWWTRNIPTGGLGSTPRFLKLLPAHEVKNLARAAQQVLAPRWDDAAWEVVYPPLRPLVSKPARKSSKSATESALELARYFSEPRDLPYDSATEQPAIKDLKYFLPSTTKPLGFLRAALKQNPRTKAWTLRRRWSENGKRKEIELYLGRPTNEEDTYIDKPSLEQFVQHCWQEVSTAKDADTWLQWFCRAQALRMAGASGADYGTEDTPKDDALQQQPKSLDTSYVASRDLVLGENGAVYEVVEHKPDTSPTFVDDALDDERVSLGELSKTLSKQEKEEGQPEEKPKQTPVVEAEEVKPKPRYAFRSEYGPRLIPKKLENAKVMCAECSQPRAVNRFNQQTEWMKLRCGHQRFLCLKCGSKCQCK